MSEVMLGQIGIVLVAISALLFIVGIVRGRMGYVAIAACLNLLFLLVARIYSFVI